MFPYHNVLICQGDQALCNSLSKFLLNIPHKVNILLWNSTLSGFVMYISMGPRLSFSDSTAQASAFTSFSPHLRLTNLGRSSEKGGCRIQTRDLSFSNHSNHSTTTTQPLACNVRMRNLKKSSHAMKTFLNCVATMLLLLFPF